MRFRPLTVRSVAVTRTGSRAFGLFTRKRTNASCIPPSQSCQPILSPANPIPHPSRHAPSAEHLSALWALKTLVYKCALDTETRHHRRCRLRRAWAGGVPSSAQCCRPRRREHSIRRAWPGVALESRDADLSLQAAVAFTLQPRQQLRAHLRSRTSPTLVPQRARHAPAHAHCAVLGAIIELAWARRSFADLGLRVWSCTLSSLMVPIRRYYCRVGGRKVGQ
ncbi:hypothetical protein DFH94DRAFT_149770 [Russula ochroleuca]|jgi:hypothetical protein|uniref:Uncharacterized protein n=1 Tax=Russula ochroleuca TaxID=152965 RepID=A0A9P5K190_9AGAM|nr:hypothetical protein DFH94DRAFT_149770 [Russula ochroleuca]